MITKKQQQGINNFLKRIGSIGQEQYLGILKDGEGKSLICDGYTAISFNDLDVSEIPTARRNGDFARKFIEQANEKGGSYVNMPTEAELSTFIKNWKKVCTTDMRRYPTYCFLVSDKEIQANAECIRDVLRIDRTCKWYGLGSSDGFFFQGKYISGALLPIRPSAMARVYFEKAMLLEK